MSTRRIASSPLASSLSTRIHWSSVLRPPNIPKAGFLGLAGTRYHAAPFLFPSATAQHASWTQPIRHFSSTAPSLSQPKPFSYSISAAYSAKRQPLNPARNIYTHNPYHRVTKTATELSSLQRKLKRPQSGQDAFFVSNIGDTAGVAFGVVDGVGGWEQSGVDPADFAHSLCDYMASASAAFPNSFGDVKGRLQPIELLDLGYQRVVEDRSIVAGGSTACIATANGNGVVDVANLGDSGFAHISPFRLNYVSPPQTHAFNTPYQLSKLPPRMLAQVALFGGAKPHAELPSDSYLSSHQLQHGDVLLFATDGVWDNLSPEDILRITSRVMVGLGGWVLNADGGVGVSPDFSALARNVDTEAEVASRNGLKEEMVIGLPAILAAAITKEAKQASLDEKRDGPFAKEVQRLFPEEHWRGGKADDICTVVAVAVQD